MLDSLINTFKTRDSFKDSVQVHTAPSGTQYVHPIDLLLPEEELRSYVKQELGLSETNGEQAKASDG